MASAIMLFYEGKLGFHRGLQTVDKRLGLLLAEGEPGAAISDSMA
jgi:hypothetical protein